MAMTVRVARIGQSARDGIASRRTPMTKNKTIKTDTETITKISDFVWELSTEMDAIKDQMEVLQLRMLSVRKMLQIMEDPKNK
ncbi:MAG: hypothetical protein H7831_10915 [Magnetococcus sp. WYHC-3]|jgi:uncharacterized coiled-coil protein SlyX